MIVPSIGSKITSRMNVDENPELFIPSLAGATGTGMSIHLVEATCNTGLQCPPYSATKVITCSWINNCANYMADTNIAMLIIGIPSCTCARCVSLRMHITSAVHHRY